MRHPGRSLLALLAAAIVAVGLASCDTTGSELEEEHLRILSASWEVTGLQVDGSDQDATVRNAYPEGLLFRLREDDVGDETFRFLARASTGDTLLFQRGDFDIDADELELTLGSSVGNIDLQYPNFNSIDFNEPAERDSLVLRSQDENDAEELLVLLGFGDFGETDNAQITIQK